MIDFHSHILPKMDDGSKSVEESCKMLKALAEQGVELVAATPHFYADDESLDSFLERRQKSFESLSEALTDDMPKLLLGAEVRYYQGISRLENLKSLCIQNSDLLLLEMPFCKWTEYTVKEVVDIAGRGDITLVLAHIERYMKLQPGRAFDTVLQAELLAQVNADFFTNGLTRRKALKMLYEQRIQLIGTDCHNLTTRPPKINEAFRRIQKKFGENFVKYINDYENNLFISR